MVLISYLVLGTGTSQLTVVVLDIRDCGCDGRLAAR